MRRRSRVMKILAGFAAVTLAGTILLTRTTLAGRLQIRDVTPEVRIAQDSPPLKTKPAEAEKSADLPVVYDEGPGKAKDVEPSLPELRGGHSEPLTTVVIPDPPHAVPAFSPDPVQSADEFVARTRKEASDAVQALNKEATALRERLAKVEAGLARYKTTLDALNAGQTVPVDKADPFRPAGGGDPNQDVPRLPSRDLPPDQVAPPPTAPTDDRPREKKPPAPTSLPEPGPSSEIPPSPLDPGSTPKPR